MAASAQDLLLKVASNTGWQLDASGISDASVTSFGLISATGLPTSTAVILTVDRVNSSGVATPTKMERIKGIVSGTSVISCTRGFEGTAQAHAAGAVVEIVISAGLWNSMIDGTDTHKATEKTTPADADELGLIDSAASYVLKKLTLANLKTALGLPISLSNAWPIGSVYIAVVSTNPATLLGFGTWSAFATGRTLVGIDSGQTEFDTVEETGGAKTVSIAHTHTIPLSGAQTAYYGGVAGNTGTAPGADYLQASHTHPPSGAMSANATPSIVQPYIVVYMWKRTA